MTNPHVLPFDSRLARGLWVERHELRIDTRISDRQRQAAVERVDQIERLVRERASNLLVDRLLEVGAARLAQSREANGFARLSGDWQPVWHPYNLLHGLLEGALEQLGVPGLRSILNACLREDLDRADIVVMARVLSLYGDQSLEHLAGLLRAGKWQPEDIHRVLEQTTVSEEQFQGTDEGGQLWHEREFAAMLTALSQGDVIDRIRAAEALGQWGDARAIPALTLLENDPDEEVRLAVSEALRELRSSGGESG